MPDITPQQNEQIPLTTRVRHRDMGDGTHALTFYIGGLASGQTIGLEAGTANIGNVDIAEKNENYVCGTVAVAGETVLRAAPGVAGERIHVTAFVIQNESAVATTISLKDGPAPRWRCWAQNQGDGLAMVFPAGRPWRLGENNDLRISLSGANQCGYSVKFYIE